MMIQKFFYRAPRRISESHKQPIFRHNELLLPFRKAELYARQ